jgi:hypothetical protein
MIHSFLSYLTAATLAMHTVLGCCWHHGHACGSEYESAVACHAATAHADHDADHCGSTDSNSGHQHHGPHTCQGGKCVFLRTAKSGADTLLDVNLPSFVCVQSSDASLETSAAPRPFFSSDALLPPLRLHLAHQVLLL